METAIVNSTVENYLATRPDPVAVATDLIPRLNDALELARTTPEANDVRTMFAMALQYLRQQLPKAVEDRWYRYDLMHPAETGYVEAAAKAGLLWAAMEGKAERGGDRQSEKHSAEPRLGIRAVDAGFKDTRDVVRCKRVGLLDEEDRRTYYLEKNHDQKHVTLDGAEKIWLLLQPSETPDLPDDKYRVIYADPPWKYSSGDQHSQEEQATVLGTHYPSMSIKELCALDIMSISQDDAVLFVWVTSPLLEECFDVINAWGFKYKASIVWDKMAHNVGHYVSVRHEFLLICTRGSCTPDTDKLLPSVVSEKRTEHSVKPETFRTMIDSMYPDGKRIELFAREKHEGWDSYGNEIS